MRESVAPNWLWVTDDGLEHRDLGFIPWHDVARVDLWETGWKMKLFGLAMIFVSHADHPGRYYGVGIWVVDRRPYLRRLNAVKRFFAKLSPRDSPLIVVTKDLAQAELEQVKERIDAAREGREPVLVTPAVEV